MNELTVSFSFFSVDHSLANWLQGVYIMFWNFIIYFESGINKLWFKNVFYYLNFEFNCQLSTNQLPAFISVQECQPVGWWKPNFWNVTFLFYFTRLQWISFPENYLKKGANISSLILWAKIKGKYPCFFPDNNLVISIKNWLIW